MSDLIVNSRIAIAERELEERFIKSSGPGGQNVNKVASAVQLRFDVARSPSLPHSVRAAILALSDARLDKDGMLTITARRFREQTRNRADARERLAELIRAAATPPKPRRATRPTLASKKRIAESKMRRGRIKKDRGRSNWD